jgi:hypothetical protein
MSEYFNTDGTLKLKPEGYFSEEEYGSHLREDVSNELDKTVADYPVKSPAVAMYYAEVMANETHGNYDPETLFRRSTL